MSRKYCEVCRSEHNNGSDGLCDKHLDEEVNRQMREFREYQGALAAFMEMPLAERWEAVFRHMQS